MDPDLYPDVIAAGSLAAALSVRIGAERRLFSVSGWSQGVELMTGATSELADAERAGVAWGQGKNRAVVLAVAHLPVGLGPAIAGAGDAR